MRQAGALDVALYAMEMFYTGEALQEYCCRMLANMAAAGELHYLEKNCMFWKDELIFMLQMILMSTWQVRRLLRHCLVPWKDIPKTWRYRNMHCLLLEKSFWNQVTSMFVFRYCIPALCAAYQLPVPC